MEPISISKRHLAGLVAAITVLSLVLGWFVGIYFFDGSGLNYSARSAADREYYNAKLGEYNGEYQQIKLFTNSQKTLGGELSTVTYEGNEKGLVYTNVRMGLTMGLPERTVLTKMVKDNPGIPVVVHEASPTEFYVALGAKEINPNDIVATTDRSILPMYIATDVENIVETGLRVEIIPVKSTELQSVLATRYPTCAVTKVDQTKVEGADLEDLDVTYTAVEGCDLTFQPFLRYDPAGERLIVGHTEAGCMFFEVSSDPITQSCLDSKMLESIAFTKAS